MSNARAIQINVNAARKTRAASQTPADFEHGARVIDAKAPLSSRGTVVGHRRDSVMVNWDGDGASIVFPHDATLLYPVAS